MSNPNKRWSWGSALGRSTGSAIAGASGGAITGSLGGPLGIPLGAAVFGVLGFTTGLMGAGLGHWWDDMLRDAETFGSGALYSLVVTGTLTVLAVLLAQPLLAVSPDATVTLSLIIGSLSVIGSASKSLIDDLHYTYFGKVGISSDSPKPPGLTVKELGDKGF
jgi:hypothetical protein